MWREGRRPVAARRRPACMDAGGRAVSGTKAEESSGLDKPFPQSGNVNRTWASDERRHPINFSIHSLPGFHSWIPAFAGMTTGVGMGLLPSDSPFAMPHKFLTLAPPSFRRRPESSGLDKPFPQSGNDSRTWASDERRHPINPAIPSLPGFHSWIPAFAGMTTGVGIGLSSSRQSLCHS